MRVSERSGVIIRQLKNIFTKTFPSLNNIIRKKERSFSKDGRKSQEGRRQ